MRLRLLALCPLLVLAGCGLFTPPDPPSTCAADDADCDGAPASEDCDDNDAGVSPLLAERCDGRDTNCDGGVDEGFDEDGDGVTTCDGDCDDAVDTTYSGAVDLCVDGVDNDCNGLVDDGPDDDADGDGVCTPFDCDDTDPGVSPEVSEVCDGDDENCDGIVDEGFDEDGDGFTSCDGDCDDTDAGVSPAAVEVCDGVDQNCDEGIDTPLQEVDGDGDGVLVCFEGDCDDTDGTVFPGAFEIPDGVDDDCDGATDEGWEGAGAIGLFATTSDGPRTQSNLGLVMSNAGDVNGDGLSDFLAASPLDDFGTGEAYLWLGTGFDVQAPATSWAPLVTITGDEEGEALGASVALVDLDDDGFDDVVVASSEGGPGPGPEGIVRIFWGSASPLAGSWDPDDADVSIVGSYAVERCGTSVVNAGDMDGDGRADLAIGCPWYTLPSGIIGRTVVFVGRSRADWALVSASAEADMVIVGQGVEENTGTILAGGFDVNGDGKGDLAIGSPAFASSRGRVLVQLGSSPLPPQIETADASRVYEGQVFDELGSWVGAGDLDGDGKDELLVGAPGYDSFAGRLGIVTGASTLPTSGDVWARTARVFAGAAPSEDVGLGGAVVELDGDGAPDLIVPVPGWDGPLGGDQGAVAVFLGPVSLGPLDYAGADASFLGAAGGDSLGLSLVPMPDANGDGQPDLLIAAPYSDAGGPSTGRLTLVPGFP